MKRFGIYLVCIGMLIFTLACGAQSPTTVTEQPPVDASKLQAPIIKLGDTWVFEVKRLGATVPYVKWSEKVISKEGDRFVVLLTDLNSQAQTRITYGPGWAPLSKQDVGGPTSFDLAQGKQPLSFPLWIGKRWKDTYKEKLKGDAPSILFRNQYTTVKEENLEVPAGSFDTWHIQISQNWVERFYSELWHQWYAPKAKRIIKLSAPGHFTMRMLSFTPAE